MNLRQSPQGTRFKGTPIFYRLRAPKNQEADLVSTMGNSHTNNSFYSQMDELLPKMLLDSSQVILSMAGSLIVAASVNLYFLIPIVVMGTLFVFVRKIYLKTSKNIKRLESIGKCGIEIHISTAITMVYFTFFN